MWGESPFSWGLLDWSSLPMISTSPLLIHSQLVPSISSAYFIFSLPTGNNSHQSENWLVSSPLCIYIYICMMCFLLVYHFRFWHLLCSGKWCYSYLRSAVNFYSIAILINTQRSVRGRRATSGVVEIVAVLARFLFLQAMQKFFVSLLLILVNNPLLPANL